jgi:hypothetical protein
MGKIRLTGATSGYTELQAASAAGNNTIILPTTNGGQVIVSDSSGNVNIDSGTFYVDASNNRVGIGTTGPGATLEVGAVGGNVTAGDLTVSTASTSSVVTVGRLSSTSNDNTTFRVRNRGGSTIFEASPTAITFGPTGTEAARIDSSSRLLVGTSTPFGLAGGSDTNCNVFIGNNGDRGSLALYYQSIGDNVCLSCRHDRAGSGFNASFVRFANNANTIIGSITGTGSAVAYNTSSDYRLKENVVSLTGAIDRLQQIPVHRFNFIADPDTTVDGFIAHEAQAVVPECVTGTKDEVDADGNPVYQGIDQSKLVPLLTAALQEAIGRIETLESEVAALKAS